jgi:hypothetical protein
VPVKSYSPHEKKKKSRFNGLKNRPRPTRRTKLCSFAILEEFELANRASWKRGVAEGGIAHGGTTLQKRTEIGLQKMGLKARRPFLQ